MRRSRDEPSVRHGPGHRVPAVAAFVLLATAACGGHPATSVASGGDTSARTYPTADEAVAAFVQASRDGSEAELLAILGPGSADVVSSGDPVADAVERARFIARYDSAHTLVESGPRRLTLEVGTDRWRMPIPLARADGRWHWDGAAGREAILGRNDH